MSKPNKKCEANNNLVRIRLTGRLTNTSPLHIGTGILQEKNTDEMSLATLTFMRDKNDLPYIPGSSLRGLLRQQAALTWDKKSELFVRLFGMGKPKKNAKTDSQMGALRVLDAHIILHQKPEDTIDKIKNDKISAQPRVSIDPITQTAKDRHLFALETLAENTEFKITLELEALGKNLLSMQDMAEIEHLLSALHQTQSLQLGKGKSIGQGLFTWQNEEKKFAQRISQKDLLTWLTDTSGKPFDSLWKKETLSHSQFNHESGFLTLPFEIFPQSAFLINANIDKQSKGEKEPAAVFQKNHDGHVLIPGSSLKGAFRAHCRKILHTLKQPNNKDDDQINTLIDQLFGQTEHSGAIKVHSAKSQENSESCTHKQYFNAIDRFTGGVKDTALYHVEAAYCAKLDGALQIKQDFFQQNPWAQALLIMLMRDAMEGDLTLGWGKAKGFGQTEFAWQLPAIAKKEDKKAKKHKTNKGKISDSQVSNNDHILVQSWSQFYDTWPKITALTTNIPFTELPEQLINALSPSLENVLPAKTPTNTKEDV